MNLKHKQRDRETHRLVDSSREPLSVHFWFYADDNIMFIRSQKRKSRRRAAGLFMLGCTLCLRRVRGLVSRESASRLRKLVVWVESYPPEDTGWQFPGLSDYFHCKRTKLPHVTFHGELNAKPIEINRTVIEIIRTVLHGHTFGVH